MILDLSGQRIAITGANGFLGRQLCRAAAAAGAVPHALVRSPSSAASLTRDGVRASAISFSDPAGLAAALHDADVIVHSAGGGRMRTLADIEDANLGTTQALLQALPTGRPVRFVLISSVAAHGPSEGDAPADESSPPRPRSFYGASKWRAEQAVLAHAGLDCISLRLPALYGPLDDRLLPLYRSAHRWGIVPTVLPDGQTGLLHVRDAAGLVLSAIARAPARSTYFADDGSPVTRRQLGHMVGAALGRDVRVIGVPLSLLWTAGLLSEGWARLSGRTVLLSRDKVADLAHLRWRFASDRARNELGWEPRVDRLAAFDETAASYREAGWLG